MSELSYWDPWRDMHALRSELEALIDRAAPGRHHGPGAPWRPVADVVESDHRTVITAELPGCKDEDVEVAVHGRVLTIRGHRTLEQESADDRVHRRERSYGDFQRAFRLPAGIEPSDIHAQVAYGVLKITIEHNAPAPTTRIPVTGGQ